MKVLLCLSALFWAATTPFASAGSATWSSNPSSSDWNSTSNWTPATVPNSTTDIATFDLSQVTAISINYIIDLDSLVFNPGASAFTITSGSNKSYNQLTFHGAGVLNNSGITQTFETIGANTGLIYFQGTATAGENVVYNNLGGSRFGDSGVFFFASSNAGSATFICNGGISSHGYNSGPIYFNENSSAATATIISNPGISVADGGYVVLAESATAANATFICNGGTVDHPNAGYMQIYDTATAGDATFILNGTDVPNASAGSLSFYYTPTAGNATLIANSGSVQGGKIIFNDTAADVSTAKVMLFGNGQLDISPAFTFGPTIGSLEGDGLVALGGNHLGVGNANSDTIFSGEISDGGGTQQGHGGTLTKVGTGTLTLSGTNTYTGNTTVSAGALVANTKRASSTGTGNVNVNGGTLGGKGMISGPVTIGTGSGSGAILAPSVGSKQPLTLSLSNTLTCQADSTYNCQLSTSKRIADEVIAKGVTIASRAQFALQAVGNKKLPSGTVFTLLSNTSASPINGTFANLADGSTLTAGRNTLQVNYTGGDGNDLTLTVQ